MRVVFDTNVFISAFAIPGGRAEEAYLAAVAGRFELFTSVAILTETANTLRSKFEWADEKIRQAIQTIHQTATILTTEPTLSVLRDDPDNRILECAVVGRADLIVTGDRHLLALDQHEGTRIIRLVDFLALLETGKTR